MSVPSHADVIVLHRRPGPVLRPGDLTAERRPLRPPGPGEVVVRNIVTTVDPYQLRMLRGSSEVTPVAIGELGGGQRVRGPGARARGPGDGLRPRLALYRQAGRPDLGRDRPRSD